MARNSQLLRMAFAYLFSCVSLTNAMSAERGLSNYLPGYFGDYAVAVAPDPGLIVYGTAYGYDANLDTVSLDATILLGGFQYVTDRTLFGARLAFGSYTTYISGEGASPLGVAKASGHGDTSVSPVVLYWSFGKFYVSLYESIIIPTGRFDVREPLNVSRNYYSFDTVLAMTWLDPGLGLEISVVPGLMVNTENPDTNYRTGTEFHMDFMLNKYFSKEFAIGLHGYVYQQVADDSGDGVVEQGLRGSSVALGPSFLWVPSSLGIKGKIVGKWLHEIDAHDRFQGDIFSLTQAVQF